jgi:hypothetical protein
LLVRDSLTHTSLPAISQPDTRIRGHIGPQLSIRVNMRPEFTHFDIQCFVLINTPRMDEGTLDFLVCSYVLYSTYSCTVPCKKSAKSHPGIRSWSYRGLKRWHGWIPVHDFLLSRYHDTIIPPPSLHAGHLFLHSGFVQN